MVSALLLYQFQTRHIVLTFVDASTGAPVRMKLTYEEFYEAQEGGWPTLALTFCQSAWGCFAGNRTC
jgi:hypothetical protein